MAKPATKKKAKKTTETRRAQSAPKPRSRRAAVVKEPPTPAAPIITIDRTVPIGTLAASPLNPRKFFDPAKTEELARSIAENGILQPLLVRRGGDGPHDGTVTGAQEYEVIIGERRRRAAALAVAEGWCDASLPVPIRIRPCTDAELVAIATTENVQREDMLPLEEAEAFATMERDLGSFDAVSKRLGVALRTVWRRVALLKLCDEIKAALAANTMQLQQAQAFALGPLQLQREWFACWDEGEWRRDPQKIRAAMTSGTIPAALAAFDIASDWPAEKTIEDAETGERFLADSALFWKLQDKAANLAVAELRENKKWKWVDRLKDPGRIHRYAVAPKGDKRAGAVVFLERDGRLVVKEGMLQPDMAQADETARRAKAAGRTGGARESDGAPRGLAFAAEPGTRPLSPEEEEDKALADRVDQLERLATAHPKTALALDIILTLPDRVGESQAEDERIAASLFPFADQFAALFALLEEGAGSADHARATMGILAGADFTPAQFQAAVRILATGESDALIALHAAINTAALVGCACLDADDGGLLQAGRALFAAAGLPLPEAADELDADEITPESEAAE